MKANGLQRRLHTHTGAFTDFLILNRFLFVIFFYDKETVICLLCRKSKTESVPILKKPITRNTGLFSFFIYKYVCNVHRDFISCLFPLVSEADWNFLLLLSTVLFFPMTFQWSSVWVCERKQNYKCAAAAFAVAGSCILSQNVLKKKKKF